MIALAIFPFLCVVSVQSQNLIKSSSGHIEGIEITTALGKSVDAYLGIPYAESPINELRFKPPVPVKPWDGVLRARAKSKSCIQAVKPEYIIEGLDWWVVPDDESSEDCLTLNIWVPKPVPEKCAVMVWVHGGGFQGGSSSTKVYDGQLLASEYDVIVVSLNYRLNVFGFLYLDPEEAPGNVGLMDQGLALKWIRNNIPHFGGDPERVTIFGQSAGGASVSYHLTIPSSRGLFGKVIAISGTSNAKWAGSDSFSARKVAEQLGHTTKCSSNAKEGKDIVACLRQMNAKTLAEAALQIPNESALPYVPVVDGSYIPEKPELAYDEVSPDIDVMLGATTEDGMIFPLSVAGIVLKENVPDTALLAFIQSSLRLNDISQAEFVKHFYTDWENADNEESVTKQLAHFSTDFFFLCDINTMTDKLVRNGNKIYRYQFNHRPFNSLAPSKLGSIHSDDLEFVFGGPLVKEKGFTDQEAKLCHTIMRLWTNFAKFGNPNGQHSDNGQEWPRYTKVAREHIYFEDSQNVTVRTAQNLRIQQCAFWDKIFPHYLQSFH